MAIYLLIIYFIFYTIKVFLIIFIMIIMDLLIFIPNWRLYIDWDNYDTIYFIISINDLADDPRKIKMFFINTFYWFYNYFRETYDFLKEFYVWKIYFILWEVKINLIHFFFIDLGYGQYFLTVFQYMDFFKYIKFIIKNIKEVKLR